MVESDVHVDAVADALSKRASLLSVLADAPSTQRELRDELGVSRSTVYKALRELEALGIVTEVDAGYDLTGFGRLAWRRHTDWLARLDHLEAARRLLSEVPSDEWLPLSLFERGHVVVPGRSDPERPLRRMERFADETSTLRCLSPAGFPRYLDPIHQDVKAGQRVVTLVVEPPAARRLSEGYERFDDVIAADGFDLHVTADELPFGMMLFDTDCIGLFVYDDGALVGAAFSEAPEALAWGETTYRAALERATPV